MTVWNHKWQIWLYMLCWLQYQFFCFWILHFCIFTAFLVTYCILGGGSFVWGYLNVLHHQRLMDISQFICCHAWHSSQIPIEYQVAVCGYWSLFNCQLPCLDFKLFDMSKQSNMLWLSSPPLHSSCLQYLISQFQHLR